MWIWNWFQGLSGEGKALIFAVAGAAAKWWMDRRFIARLRGEIKCKEEELRRKEDELSKKEHRLDDVERELNAAKEKIDRLKGALRGSESGIWTTFPRRPPFADFDARIGRRSPIILTVANNKGGVGKTTLVGNLLAYFEKKKGLRVLALDMDYQGSLTTMLQGQQDLVVTGKSDINSLLTKGADLATLLSIVRGLGAKLSNSGHVSAFYDLALLEDQLMVDWLLQEDDGDDVRYRLANLLLQPQITQRFDLVLIDVPPRLTTGTMNALCSSTHILIPTIFNPIAAEPVPNFLDAASRLLHELNPAVKFAGIVETMSPPDTVGQPTRIRGRGMIEAALRRHPGLSILENHVPRRVPIAEGGVAYLADASARAIFDKVGDEISTRIGL